MALTGYSVVDGGRGASRVRDRLAASNIRLAGEAAAFSGRFFYPDEPNIGHYPGVVRLLIAIGLSVALWAAVLLGCGAVQSLLSQG